MKNTLKRFTAALFVLSNIFVRTALLGELTQEAHIASLLQRHYETIAYTRTDLLQKLAAEDLNAGDDETNLRLPFVGIILGLQALGPQALADLSRNYSAVFVGAKDFVAPNGFGMVGSHDCYIGILKGDTQPNIEVDFHNGSYQPIDGRNVWVLPLSKEGAKGDSLYAAQVGETYFVMTNSRDDFVDVARELTRKGSITSAKERGPDWTAFSSYSYWVYRLIRRAGITDLGASGTEDLSPGISALAFFVDVEKREGFLQVFTSGDRQTSPTIFPSAKLKTFQPLEAGVWQMIVPLPNDKTGAGVLFQIFYRFGFGIFA